MEQEKPQRNTPEKTPENRSLYCSKFQQIQG